jgi:hypothetical protein
MSQRSREPTNLEALDRFWRRSPFHDRPIEVVTALNKRVVIRLKDLTLIITGATDLMRCKLPAVWLRESLVLKGERFSLDVETDTGHLLVSGNDVRLIRNNDLAMLIPPIDA